jgi:hypothetical protein
VQRDRGAEAFESLADPYAVAVNSDHETGDDFVNWSAAKSAGLDLYRWDTGDYPVWFMARVVAHYELDNMVTAHVQRAANKKAEANARQKGKR